jgi:hypothetical protein
MPCTSSTTVRTSQAFRGWLAQVVPKGDNYDELEAAAAKKAYRPSAREGLAHRKVSHFSDNGDLHSLENPVPVSSVENFRPVLRDVKGGKDGGKTEI